VGNVGVQVRHSSLFPLRPTSAMDKVARSRGIVMTATKPTSKLSPEFVDAKLEDGPDPMLVVQEDMKLLKKKIRGVIERNLGSGEDAHPALKSSSKEFFERPEKTWRPMVALLLSRAIKSLKGEDYNAHHGDAMVIAEIIEIMHTSTIIHDTVSLISNALTTRFLMLSIGA